MKKKKTKRNKEMDGKIKCAFLILYFYLFSFIYEYLIYIL